MPLHIHQAGPATGGRITDKIEIKDGCSSAYGVYEATGVLTCSDRIVYYQAYADSSAVGLVKARTEKLPELPPFGHATAAEYT